MNITIELIPFKIELISKLRLDKHQNENTFLFFNHFNRNYINSSSYYN